MDNLVASAISNKPHLTAFDNIFQVRFSELEMQALCVYLVDICPVEVLPLLADQFDVLGYKGWFLTTTEESQRELIKSAIELHRYKGTPYAIKTALESVGFGNCTLVEGDVDSWANFSVVFDLGNYQGLYQDDLAPLYELVSNYKPARCKLVALSFVMNMTEDVQVTDESLAITGYKPYQYNGAYTHNGDIKYGGSANVVEL
jgi:phage tail P2-like protein